MKIQAQFRYGILAVFVLIWWSYPSSSAQGAIRERIRERIKEKTEERRQEREQKRGKISRQDHHFSLEYDGLKRQYDVYLPYNYDGKTPVPVVVYLHGGGGSIKAATNDGMKKSADKGGFILVVPAGTGPIPNKLLTWNSGQWDTGECCGTAVKTDVNDVGFISQVIDEVKKKFLVDETHVYVTGISNGAMMSFRLACELSDKIAAVAPVAAPAVPVPCTPKRPVPVIYTHGTSDPCVRYDGEMGAGCMPGGVPLDAQGAKDIAQQWVKINGCDADSVKKVYEHGTASCQSYQSCQNSTEVVFCTVDGMGHVWPSGAQYFSEQKIGSVSYDISFDQLWDFLRKHGIQN